MAAPPGVTQLDPGDFPNLPDRERLVRALNPFLQATSSALQAGLTFGENFAAFVKAVEVTCPEDWRTPTMGAGWSGTFAAATDPQPMSFRKRPDGKVEVRGRADYPSGTPTSGAALATLGSVYAPAHRETFDVYATDGTTYTPASLQVSPGTGAITWIASAGGYRGLSFSGDVWWMAADRTPLAWDTPVDFSLPATFPGKPGAVLLLRAEELGSGAPIAAVSVDGWRLQTNTGADGKQIVRLPRVNGLTPGLKYRLTLLVLPE